MGSSAFRRANVYRCACSLVPVLRLDGSPEQSEQSMKTVLGYDLMYLCVMIFAFFIEFFINAFVLMLIFAFVKVIEEFTWFTWKFHKITLLKGKNFYTNDTHTEHFDATMFD